MKDVIIINIPGSSSGLGRYITDALTRSGCRTRVLDPLASKWHKLWPVIRSFSFNKDRMWRRRWENELFSSSAWDRNTRHIGRRLDSMRGPDSKVLIVGKDFFPHPGYRQQEYFVFIHSNMRISLADGVTPWLPPKHDVGRFLERETLLFRHARHVFVGAKYVADSLVHDYGVSADRITVAGGGVNEYFEANMPEAVPSDFVRTMIFVGWDFGMKGGADVLKAFPIARAVLPDLKLKVVGPPAEGQPNIPGVEFTGPVRDRATLLAHYRSADLFVMPSLRDSFGFVFLEAMSQGLPCIGSTLHAMPEIIQPGVCGLVVPPRDPEALARAIIAYYAVPSNRLVMGRNAMDRVRNEYTWKTTINRMKPIIWPER